MFRSAIDKTRSLKKQLKSWFVVNSRLRQTREFFRLPPIQTEPDSKFAIHTLFSKKDFALSIVSMQSFLYFSEIRNCSLNFHGDSSVTVYETNQIAKLFPGSKVHMRGESDNVVEQKLNKCPCTLQFRMRFPLMQKLIDPFLVQNSERLLFLDSDVLFFDRPKALLEGLGEDCFVYNRDLESSYIITSGEAKAEFGLELPGRVNSGLWSVPSSYLDLDLIERFLGHPNFENYFLRRPHVTEQTLVAMLAAQWAPGHMPLPPEYDVELAPARNGVPCKHYVGRIRDLYFSDGVAKLKGKQFCDGFRSRFMESRTEPPS